MAGNLVESVIINGLTFSGFKLDWLSTYLKSCSSKTQQLLTNRQESAVFEPLSSLSYTCNTFGRNVYKNGGHKGWLTMVPSSSHKAMIYSAKANSVSSWKPIVKGIYKKLPVANEINIRFWGLPYRHNWHLQGCLCN